MHNRRNRQIAEAVARRLLREIALSDLKAVAVTAVRAADELLASKTLFLGNERRDAAESVARTAFADTIDDYAPGDGELRVIADIVEDRLASATHISAKGYGDTYNPYYYLPMGFT